jgi:hypothetical protein
MRRVQGLIVRDGLPIMAADSSGGEDRLTADGSAADCTFKSWGSLIKTTSCAARAPARVWQRLDFLPALRIYEIGMR